MHQIEWREGGATEVQQSPDGVIRKGETWLILVGDVGALIHAGVRRRLEPRAFVDVGGARLRWFPAPVQTTPRLLAAEPTQRERGSATTRAFLLDNDGGKPPLPLPAGGLCLIGRHPWCDVVLDDPRVSALHAIVRGCDGSVVIHDNASTNGTFVNGVRVNTAGVAGHAAVHVGRKRLQIRPDLPPDGVVLSSLAMRRVEELVARFASADCPVLIQGESGVGKERVAHRLHVLSGRGGPFVALNAAALTPQLAGSELFGHVSGAFTGAERDHVGAFRAAHAGTLFLDEIAELRIDVQAELLRVLEEKRVRPVGSTQTVPIDVRLVTATHRDLLQAARQGTFRDDLLHRIHVLPIRVPPLRERRDDIDAIADAFLGEAERRLSAAGRAHLHRHAWPGNIRELINVLRRACALTDDFVLGPQDLQLLDAGASVSDLDALIHRTVVETFARCGQSVEATAQSLGVHRATVYRHLRRARGSAKAA